MNHSREPETAGALELRAPDPFVFCPADLRAANVEIRRALEHCDLCLVACRPRLGLVASSLVLKSGGREVAGAIEIGTGSTARYVPFAAVLPGHFQAVAVEQRPHAPDVLRLFTRGGHAMRIGLQALLCLSDAAHSPLTDMRVEYVGRVPEEDGYGDVVDRLVGGGCTAGDEPLREVLGDLNARRGAQDVHLLLCQFEFVRPRAIGGLGRIDRGMRADLAEAALVRYFGPGGNDRYPASATHARLQMLDRAGELGITSLALSLSTAQQGLRLHSNGVRASDEHAMAYPIATSEHRLAFLTSHALAP